MARLVRRWERKMDGGVVHIRLYDDGHVRVRTDHPTNDAAIEIAMAAKVIAALTDSMQAFGVEPQLGPLQWRSDPA